MAEKSGAVKQTSKTRTKVIPKKDEDSESNVSQSDEDQQEYDSDALDGSEDEAKMKKRKRVSSSQKKTTRSPRKKQKASESEEDDFDLKDGQEIVGVVVQAPKTGRGKCSVTACINLAHKSTQSLLARYLRIRSTFWLNYKIQNVMIGNGTWSSSYPVSQLISKQGLKYMVSHPR